MAKRKTAARRATPRANKSARSRAGARTAATRAGTARAARKPSGRAAATGRSTSAKDKPVKGSGERQKRSRRRRNPVDVRDVTADVQRRWDLEEEEVPTPPSTLDLDRKASAAGSGRQEMLQRRRRRGPANSAVTGGDVDADWEDAYFVGEEAPGGGNPTPDQDDVEAVGHAVGVDYDDAEELKSAAKIDKRDKKRWELNPASAEDYKERNKRRR